VHRRKVSWRGEEIAIDDEVSGGGVHDIELRLHINPALKIEMVRGVARVRERDLLLATIALSGAGRIELSTGWYCPEFGRFLPCPLLLARHSGAPLPFRGGWRIALT
jgi:hypothetical protein